ncbi:unnamed protein product [Schistocephalus solidus]|nr:unnamed protein product [Schistocephalus solidus]
MGDHLVRTDDERLPKRLFYTAMERPPGKNGRRATTQTTFLRTAIEWPPGKNGRRATTQTTFLRRWSGHLVRMDDERLPKRIFYGDVWSGHLGGGDYPNDFSTEMSLRVLAGREVKDYPNDFSTVMSLRVLAGREVKKAKRLFYGDVATGARRQGGQKRRLLRQVQLRWSGHLVRMDDERLPKGKCNCDGAATW